MRQTIKQRLTQLEAMVKPDETLYDVFIVFFDVETGEPSQSIPDAKVLFWLPVNGREAVQDGS